MKSSDERIDEELRKALKERFDNFERLPDPTLREKVLGALPGNKSIVQTTLIASLLLLIGLTMTVYFGSQPAVERVRNVDVVTAQPKARVNTARPGISATRPSGTAALRKPVSQVQQPEKEYDSAFKSVTHATRARKRTYRVTRADLVKWIEIVKADPSFGSVWVRNSDVSPEDRTFFENELNKVFAARATDSLAKDPDDKKVLEGPSMADQDIGVLDHRPLALPQYAWQPDSLVTPGEPRKRYDYFARERWSLITSFTPLRTFQILTVRPGNGVVYQNFQLPTKISAATVGFKLSAGAERKGFQFLLNYGQFRQSYRYEIATSEFQVGPDLSGNYEVVRKGIPQQENSTVRLLGVSVKKHTVRRSHFLRNYYGDFGAEFNRDLTSERNLVWLNVGFGKELFAGNNVLMTVGPYLEYSFSKLRNPDNPFKIQPYQIGLSVGLRYTKR
ncbi:hypothetical protein GCM10010967_28450 [Dyadobacter beijingensis]|uniref:Outer membrane protein beta-barrel domain-containing protein n=1 Tax=Dyadobacter beijingensis TaxID=365489 RepID=A0ABQ2HWF5_9BACT|nr:hypothetical protein [Dyadobacter beijingensis]GGM93593.1 hypothetical protein GCM10010967_28450 [Dyadobacter beijingensis]